MNHPHVFIAEVDSYSHSSLPQLYENSSFKMATDNSLESNNNKLTNSWDSILWENLLRKCLFSLTVGGVSDQWEQWLFLFWFCNGKKKNQNVDGVIFSSNTLHKMYNFIMITYMDKMLAIRYSWFQLVSTLYFVLQYLNIVDVCC